jgi:hypothetical protein
MSPKNDATAGGDAGARRRRVLAAHAELFNEALTDEADRLAKLANVVEALALASDAEPLGPLASMGDHGELRCGLTLKITRRWPRRRASARSTS